MTAHKIIEGLQEAIDSVAPITEKNAVLNAHLSADNGYTSHETHRISPDQWGRICEIMNEPDELGASQ